MEISGLEDEFRLAAGKPMLLSLNFPAPDQEPGLTAMIEGIRSAGAVSYRQFATARELERLLISIPSLSLSQSSPGTRRSTLVRRVHRRPGLASSTPRSCRPGH